MLKLDEPPLRTAGPTEDAAVSPAELEHLDYLERMVEKGYTSRSLADQALSVWKIAKSATHGQLPVPAASTDEGGPFQYYWSEGNYQIHCEIGSDEPVCWVYRDRSSGDFQGDEIPFDSPLPLRLIEILNGIAASRTR